VCKLESSVVVLIQELVHIYSSEVVKYKMQWYVCV
jgi:hypothetical protein